MSFEAEGTNSTGEGVGPSVDVTTPQLSVVTDDLMMIFVTTSVNGATPPTISTPAGWTLEETFLVNELRCSLFYRRALTNNVPYPNLTLSSAAEWCVIACKATDVDWNNGPFGAKQTATAISGNYDNPNITNTYADALLLSFAGTERYTPTLDTDNSAINAFLVNSQSTGGSEGIDNSAVIVKQYQRLASQVNTMAQWIHSGSDCARLSIEIPTNGNFYPGYSNAGSPANLLTIGGAGDLRDLILDSGVLFNGDTPTTWTFDASTANPTTDEVTVTSHAMDESMVVRLEANSATPPTGLTDGHYYFVRPTSANTIQFANANNVIDARSEFYVDRTVFLPAINITAAGSGTVTLREARMMYDDTATFLSRSANGSGLNPGANSGSWIGDPGWNQNYYMMCREFTGGVDFSSGILAFNAGINIKTKIEEVIMTFIDTDGDRIDYYNAKQGVTPSTNQSSVFYQLELGSSVVQATAIREVGTFNPASIQYFIVSFVGNNTTTTRPDSSAVGATSLSRLLPLRVVGGSSVNPITFAEIENILKLYSSVLSDAPSDLQTIFQTSFQIGDGGVTDSVIFSDSEKSVAFPPLSDGITEYRTRRESIGLFIDAGASDVISAQNSSVGASLPFNFEVTANAAASVNLNGNIYVLGNVTLDADFEYRRQLFVGGRGVTDNGATIRNSTFIVTSDIAPDDGMITWTGSTDIQDTGFEAGDSLTDGHAIIIETPGTYSFVGLTFTGFGADGTDTAAVYNNSGGAVTINITNGDTPTVRNGSGASTTVNNAISVQYTVVDLAGSPIENAAIYVATTPGGVEVIKGTTNASGILSGSTNESGAITGRVRKLGYNEFPILGSVGSGIDQTVILNLKPSST